MNGIPPSPPKRIRIEHDVFGSGPFLFFEVSEYIQRNTVTNLLVIERYMGVNNNIKTLAAVINVNGKHDDVHLKQGLVCQIMSLKTPIIK